MNHNHLLRFPPGVPLYAPDEGVDLDGINIVHLLDGILDLALVRLDVDNEDEGVVLLDLLHGGLGVQGVNDDPVLVEPRSMVDGLAGVFGLARELEGLGAVESDRGADLLVDVGVRTLEGRLLRVGGLLGGRLRPWISIHRQLQLLFEISAPTPIFSMSRIPFLLRPKFQCRRRE